MRREIATIAASTALIVVVALAWWMSHPGGYATFYSVEEGEVRADRKWSGETLESSLDDFEFTLILSKDDDSSSNIGTESTEFRLSYEAKTLSGRIWSHDSIAITFLELRSPDSMNFMAIPTLERADMSNWLWLELYEPIPIPDSVTELDANFALVVYNGKEQIEESFDVRLYRKDIGLFPYVLQRWKERLLN